MVITRDLAICAASTSTPSNNLLRHDQYARNETPNRGQFGEIGGKPGLLDVVQDSGG